jgi:2-haloacid dehalogenase
MAIKNIIFDFGGVLLDWNPRYFFKNIFSDETEMEYFLREVCNPQWNMAMDAGLTFADATKEVLEKYPKYTKEIELYLKNWEVMISGEISANTSLLKPLRTKYRLFGLTNWSAEAFPVVYVKYDFFKNFEGIVVSGTEKMVKPDKAIYELLLKRYDLKAEESLFIDDSLKNVEAAKGLGFATIHVNGDDKLEDQLKSSGLL